MALGTGGWMVLGWCVLFGLLLLLVPMQLSRWWRATYFVLVSAGAFLLWGSGQFEEFQGWSKHTALACLLLWVIASRKLPQPKACANWLTVVFMCILLVSLFSSPAGASSKMLPFFRDVLGLSPEAAEMAVAGVRKAVHVTFYGVLSVSAFLAFYAAKTARTSALISALALVLMTAALDEGQQSLYSNRNGSGWDVLLDMFGAACFLAWASASTRTRHP